jgi:hypothetical protein
VGRESDDSHKGNWLGPAQRDYEALLLALTTVRRRACLRNPGSLAFPAKEPQPGWRRFPPLDAWCSRMENLAMRRRPGLLN